jgi:hypothetical protein
VWTTDETYDSDAPIEALWPLYTSAVAWPRWADDIEWATAEGRFEAGLEGTVKYRGLPRAPFSVLGADAPRLFRIRLRLPLTTVTFDHRLTPIRTGTRIQERIDFGGLLAPILGLVERSRIRRDWPAAMAKMTALAHRLPEDPGASSGS